MYFICVQVIKQVQLKRTGKSEKGEIGRKKICRSYKLRFYPKDQAVFTETSPTKINKDKEIEKGFSGYNKKYRKERLFHTFASTFPEI